MSSDKKERWKRVAEILDDCQCANELEAVRLLLAYQAVLLEELLAGMTR